MADKLTPEQRRKCMQGNKAEDTKPEMVVRRYLFSHGFHYRLHVKNLPGKPDIVLRKYSTVIFVNGCFWHGHQNCQYYKLPASNVDFWRNKIENNQLRDARVKQQLVSMGWAVMTVWECQLRPANVESTLTEILYDLSSVYLKKQKSKVPQKYNVEFEEDIRVAAEEEATYGHNS